MEEYIHGSLTKYQCNDCKALFGQSLEYFVISTIFCFHLLRLTTKLIEDNFEKNLYYHSIFIMMTN